MAGIKKVAVIGAGVMGSGIAAHAANAGAQVVLLDIEEKFAAAGVAKQIKTGGFMVPDFAKQVTTGSVADNLDMVADADWIVEAVAERVDIKQELYRKIAKVKKPDAIISSNTSTIPLRDLTAGLPSDFVARFMITHFFNPPRIMRLFELVAGPQTDADAVETMRDYADRELGKGVVDCNDTPGFIGNRIGNCWMMNAEHEAIKAGLDVEEADALMGAPFGIPRSGIFGLLDLVGIDLMGSVMHSFKVSLAPDDILQDVTYVPELVQKMVRNGQLGRKSGAGFYKVSRDRKTREVIDLTTGIYRPQKKAQSDAIEAAKAGPRALMESDTPGGRYASLVMRRTLSYAVSLIPEIADTPYQADQALTLGFAWKQGPFALIDSLGVQWFADHLRAHDEPVPAYLEMAVEAGGFYRQEKGKTKCLLPNGDWHMIEPAPGVLSLPVVRAQKPAVQSSDSASLWDAGDGVALLEMHTKVNALGRDMMAALASALEKSKAEFSALVIGSGHNNFSVGADLAQFIKLVEAGDMAAVDAHLSTGQEFMRQLKFSSIPVVSAASGFALGGGCEVALHSTAIVAHAEVNAGLVETAVGLIPGWGGCKEALLRAIDSETIVNGPVAPALVAFDLISQAKRSKSAADARKLGLLTKSDSITMNIERVLGDAKAKALQLAANFEPRTPREVQLAGPSGAAALGNIIDGHADAGRIKPHDRVIAELLASVLTGGPSADPSVPVSENVLFDLEKAAFLELLGYDATRERIQHMLATGKPLRN